MTGRAATLILILSPLLVAVETVTVARADDPVRGAAYWSAAADGDLAAKVGPRTITAGEVRAAARASARRESPESASPAVLTAALEILVARELILADLVTQKRGVAAADIDLIIAESKKSAAERGEDWAKRLAATGRDEAGYRRDLEWQLAWTRELARVQTDAALTAWFDAHRRDYDGTKLDLRQIFLAVPSDAAEADRSSARSRLVSIAAEIRAGTLTFAEAAQRHSEAESKARGGALGEVARHGELPEPVARAAFVLEPGQISPPVDSPLGLHLLQCDAVRPGRLTLDETRTAVARDQARAEFESRAARLRQVPGAVRYDPRLEPASR
jgi:hypothetical protein